MWIILFLCLPYFCSVESSLAPFIAKCKLGDSKCIKESTIKALPIFAEGLPDLKVESLDPLKIALVNASKLGLEIIVTDIVLTGLKGCKVNEAKQDPIAENLLLELDCTCVAKGQYKMNGQLLLIPITGEGQMITEINQILITVNANYTSDNVDKAGKKYWHLKTWKYDYNLKGKSHVTFENLFPTNKVLRDSTNEVITQNGNEVIKEMGTPLITAVVTKIVKSAANFMKYVPLEDLIIQ